MSSVYGNTQPEVAFDGDTNGGTYEWGGTCLHTGKNLITKVYFWYYKSYFMVAFKIMGREVK